MNSIDKATIASIREDKRRGLSLNALAAKYHVAKSTASYYCRDLFNNSRRIYQTEGDARHRITAISRRFTCRNCGLSCKHQNGLCLTCYRKLHPVSNSGNDHNHKLYPCTSCKTATTRKQDGLCLKCYREAIHKQALQHSLEKEKFDQEKKHRQEVSNQKYATKVRAATTPCPDSPNQAHFWRISSDNIGICKYCHARKDMSEDKPIVTSIPKPNAPIPTTPANIVPANKPTITPKPTIPDNTHSLEYRFNIAWCRITVFLAKSTTDKETIDGAIRVCQLVMHDHSHTYSLKQVYQMELEASAYPSIPDDIMQQLSDSSQSTR